MSQCIMPLRAIAGSTENIEETVVRKIPQSTTRTDIPSATTEKCFSSSFLTTYSPGPSTICHSSVNCTLINKHKLVGFVSPDACRTFAPFLRTTFNCNLKELEVLDAVKTK